MIHIRSKPFLHLVQALKEQGRTCTVVESCCGGLINASIMTVPGSSSVFYGGSVAYNTKRAKKLLLNDDTLHDKLVHASKMKVSAVASTASAAEGGSEEGDAYVRSKMIWTAETAKAFCEQLDVDYAIAEGGAAGPTFRPKGMDKGFAVVAIAGRDANGKGRVLAQTTVHSPHANRQSNMRLFADAAANLAYETITGETSTTMKEEPQHPRSTTWLDRATSLRSDADALQKLGERSDAKYVVLRDSKECLFSSNTELALLSRTDVPMLLPKTFLGLEHLTGAPIFSVDIHSNDNDPSFEIPTDTWFDNTRTHAPMLHPKDYELALYATALSQWKETHKYCSVCGTPLTPVQGGTCLECQGCKSLSWPRQDPSIIVLITNRSGDKAFLARSPRHPPKVHTTLAGFVEAGETFEQAVVREALEETGVRVDPESIKYLASQPWPFPRSCMVGFHATADDALPLTIDTNELVSASWFDKSEIAASANVRGPTLHKDAAEQAVANDPSLNLLIPPRGVIARYLIDQWLAKE